MNKEEQKKILIEMMEEDEKLGLYKQRTAVEWLEIHLLGLISFDSEVLREKYKDKIKQAKQKEREQIIQAWENGALPDLIKEYKNSRTYYNETYGKDSN